MPHTKPDQFSASAIQNLKATHPDLEVWWDSSPLVYTDWLAGPGSNFHDANLFCMEDDQGTSKCFMPASLLQGATTNQPLTWQVIEKDPDAWAAWLAEHRRCEPGLTVKEAMWRLFIEIASRGADLLEPIFLASDRRLGQICCQVDPRDLTDLPAMLDQARRIHAARPNIMIKLPGTAEGVEAVRILTAEGIPTNVTLGFTVAQLVAVGEAAQAGLAEAQRRGTDLRNWRSCAVMMLGRYEDAPPLKEQAAVRGIQLSDADLRWAGIAIFREAYRIFRERDYPSKLMAASMRLGPVVEGQARVWHLEKLAGANAVLTVFPNILEAFLDAYAGKPLAAQATEPVPEDVMARLLQIPYFVEGFREDGLASADFAHHPALRLTADSFSQAMEQIEGFIEEQFRVR